MTNRNAVAIDSLVFTLYSDSDLGDFFDDYIGSDPERDLFFVYNSDNEDDAQEVPSYGDDPPALGVRLLDAEAGAVGYFNSVVGAADGDPTNAQEFYRYMTGRWKDGRPFTYGGSGFGGTEPYPFVYPSAPGTYWSEFDVTGQGQANTPSDRRGMISTVPERLEPGAARTYTLAIVYGRGDDHLASVDVMKANADYVQNAFDLGVLVAPSPALPPPAPVAEPTPQFGLGQPVPNPATSIVWVRYGTGRSGFVRLAVYDALGRLVALPLSGVREAEEDSVALDVSGWAAGVYTVVFEAGGEQVGRRFTVAR